MKKKIYKVELGEWFDLVVNLRWLNKCLVDYGIILYIKLFLL